MIQFAYAYIRVSHPRSSHLYSPSPQARYTARIRAFDCNWFSSADFPTIKYISRNDGTRGGLFKGRSAAVPTSRAASILSRARSTKRNSPFSARAHNYWPTINSGGNGRSCEKSMANPAEESWGIGRNARIEARIDFFVVDKG